MSKRKDRRHVQLLYEAVSEHARAAAGGKIWPPGLGGDPGGHDEGPIEDTILASSPGLSCILDLSVNLARELPKMKKFRFQLLHQWLTGHLAPCRVADVGGGKGLLAYLLQQSGWDATVIDPTHQPLGTKYKNLATGQQVRIPATEQVTRLESAFNAEMAQDFDLLIAMHAHGCIIQTVDAAARYGRNAIILPCCIIHEPIVPPPGVHWLQCVVDYAVGQGLTVEPFRLNFKGQNIGLHLHGRAPGR